MNNQIALVGFSLKDFHDFVDNNKLTIDRKHPHRAFDKEKNTYILVREPEDAVGMRFDYDTKLKEFAKERYGVEVE